MKNKIIKDEYKLGEPFDEELMVKEVVGELEEVIIR